jgi:hypothetical protein
LDWIEYCIGYSYRQPEKKEQLMEQMMAKIHSIQEEMKTRIDVWLEGTKDCGEVTESYIGKTEAGIEIEQE